MKNTAVFFSRFTRSWIQFQNPVRILTARRHSDMEGLLREIESATAAGMYAAGFISYEAAPAFDEAMTTFPPSRFPICWFGIYDRFSTIDLPDQTQTGYSIGKWEPAIDQKRYNRDIARIHELIAGGYTYQVNYTYRLHAAFTGDPWSFFLDLVGRQNTPFSAFIDTGDFTICSVSPELFFLLDGNLISSKPMKGTAARGRYPEEDREQADRLYHSEKDRAENSMIVDMVRNDLGRIAAFETVATDSLYHIEKYPTAFQMTSTVTAETGASIGQILTALFPGASITGAPKIETMKIIRKLETTPRNIYTGTIGFAGPGRKAQFNIAIRTVLIDRKNTVAEYGTGGGIVADSEKESEFLESRTKARVLFVQNPSFDLLETMLWTPAEGFFLLDYHLKRLQNSAAYFDFTCNTDHILAQLEATVPAGTGQPQKVRLLLNRNGSVRIESETLAPPGGKSVIRLCISECRIDAADPMLYHKTTDRRIYDSALKEKSDCDDVILINQYSEITETSICNLIIESDAGKFTPALQCGLLPGTFRAWLLDRKHVKEKVITLEDLFNCRKIFLINSVRKWQEAELVL